jgi:hypothetical protein
MKSFCSAMALAALVAGCASPSTPSANPAASNASTVYPAANYTSTPGWNLAAGAPPGASASMPPRLTVGTSYPDTQLVLPWFLNDVINLVNYR